jgi:hypothetical protein
MYESTRTSLAIDVVVVSENRIQIGEEDVYREELSKIQ